MIPGSNPQAAGNSFCAYRLSSILPGSSLSMPAVGFPIAIIRLGGREVLVGCPHQGKPQLRPEVVSLFSGVFADFPGQRVRFFSMVF